MQMVAPRKKQFDGNMYDFGMGFEYKYEANKYAANMRSGAYLARVIQIPGIRGYFVYTRPKRRYR